MNLKPYSHAEPAQLRHKKSLLCISPCKSTHNNFKLHVPFHVSQYTATPSHLRLQIEGEKLILKANGANGTLATCALRPSGLFGKGDTTFWPTVVAKAKQGKMKYIIGNGQNLVEFTYVGNVAQAHLQVKLSAASLFCTRGVQ